MRRFLLLIAFTTAISAAAEEPRRAKPRQFQATEKTADEIEAARVRARYRMNTWREAEPQPEAAEFPWMQVGFTLLAFAIVAPFAWSSYRATAKDLTNQVAFRVRRQRRAPEDD